MKKILSKFILIFFVLISPKSISQINEIQKIDKNEYLIIEPGLIGGIEKNGNCVECGLNDINFGFTFNFGTAMNNYFLVEQARKGAFKAWYNRQKELIENYLESNFNQEFSSFNEARNYLINELEKKNVDFYYNNLSSKYNYRLNSANAVVKKNTRNLKLLKQRRFEIERGQINTSWYPNIEVNGVKLLDYTSVNQINSVWSANYDEFSVNYIKKSLNASILNSPYFNTSSIEQISLNEKVKYFDKLNDWDRLKLMNILMHFEKNRNEIQIPLSAPIEYQGYMNYFQYEIQEVEQKIISTKNGPISIFDNVIIMNRAMGLANGGADWPYFMNQARQQVEKEREVYLNNLLDETSIGANSSVDFMIGYFQISNENQQIWLNDNPVMAKAMKDVVDKTIRMSQSFAHYFYNTRIKPDIEFGAQIVQLIKDLKITNEDQKKWMYTKVNKEEMTNLINFVNKNSINGIVDSKAENFANLAIDNNSIKYINENFELSKESPYNVDMSQVLDSIALPKNDSLLIANQKFLCIYEKLTASTTYKNLFVNIFGGNQDVLNVQFKITKDLKNAEGESDNGKRTVKELKLDSNGIIVKADMLIEIDEDLLTSNSNFNATKTILHESIHAYLTVKHYQSNTAVSIGELNFEDFSATINSNYSGVQGQHEFMFDLVLPIFKNIFNEIGKENLTSQASIESFNSINLQYLNPLPNINFPNKHIFDWDEFYYYFSLQGLHKTTSFDTKIKNDSIKFSLYNAYTNVAKYDLI